MQKNKGKSMKSVAKTLILMLIALQLGGCTVISSTGELPQNRSIKKAPVIVTIPKVFEVPETWDGPLPQQ